MNRMEQIAYLNRRLLEEMPEYRDQAARVSGRSGISAACSAA